MISTGAVVRLVLAFVVSVIVVRALGPAEYGVYVTLGALAAIGGGLADFGLSDSAVPRLITDPDDRTAARSFFWLRVLLAIVVGGTGAAILIGIGWPAAWVPVLLVALGMLATAIAGAAATLVQAGNRFGIFAVLPVVNSGITLAAAILLAMTGRLSLVSVLVWLGIVPAIVAAIFAFAALPARWRPGFPLISGLRRWFRESAWIGVGNSFALLSVSLDVVVIGAMLGPATAGLYGLALSIAGKADVLSGSLYSVLLPAAARRDAIGGRSHLVRGSVALSIVLVGSVAAGPFIAAVYGTEFVGAAVLVAWLLAAVALDIVAAPLQPIAIAHGRTRLLAAGEGARCIVVVVSLIVLVPVLGPVGAALARILGRLTHMLVLAQPTISSYRERKVAAAASSE